VLCQSLLYPGHSIEAGWFLFARASKTNDAELKQTAIDKFILNPFGCGWDKQDGGLFYFLDVDGWSPTQLEWDMKLWWPHNEALIAFLMTYKETNEVTMLDKFAQVFDYVYSKVGDCFIHKPNLKL
jgi:N-acylglucosamine 2-epimerase